MSDLSTAIGRLVSEGAVRISAHGYDELAEDGLYATEIVNTYPQQS